MKELIGKRLLKTITPQTKSYDIRDTRLKGFFLRVQPSGHMTYYCEYARGKKYFLGKADAINPDDAREKARQVLADATNGIDPNEIKKAAKVHGFKSYIKDEYGPWVKANRKSGDATLARLNACFADLLSNTQLNEITPWVIKKWQTSRLKNGVSPSTINRDITTLKAALSHAVEDGFLKDNPLAAVKRLASDSSPKPRYLSPGEEVSLREALEARELRLCAKRDSANEWRSARGYPQLPDIGEMSFADSLKPMVLLSINTGMRRGEVFHLKWEDVDLSQKTITVAGSTAKSGKTRHLPLNDEAYDALSAWQKQTGGTGKALVFPGREGEPLDNVRKSWGSLLIRAGIENFRWHDLRHHFSSRLVMAGVDLNTVRELLGHSDIKMTLRYAHLAPQHKADAVAKLTPQLRVEVIDGNRMESSYTA